MKIDKAEFITSIADYSNTKLMPRKQIAIVGRSNVGKSTLINILCNRRKLAKVSSTPGKTRLINIFNINDSFYLVDLPGYGFARVSPTERERWRTMMEDYFTTSEDLKHIFLLLDIRREPTQDDLQMSLWIQHANIPCTIIATKADKIAKSKRKNITRKFSDKLAMTFVTPTIEFSSLDKTGVKDLLSRLDEVLAD